MDSATPRAVGIDLGTTYSVVAWVDLHGRPTTLVNAEGDRLTPSVVLFDGDDVVVGKEALRAMATEAPRVAECAKRDIGQRTFHKVLDGKEYAPEVIEAWILDRLRRDAIERLGPVAKAVITVPAYFDEVRRKATQDAGYMAGFDVLDIINEPTAAALACAYQGGCLAGEGNDDRPRRLLVFDLGGGTFDVSVLEIRAHRFATLATDGDVQLGGYDWDQRLVTLVAERFRDQHGIDPRDEPRSAARLWQECEAAKRILSTRDKAAVACDCHGVAWRMDVTRQEFEQSTHDLLDRTRFTSVETLRAAGLQWSDLDRVLLVGGSTRMPMVRAMLEEVSGQRPDASVSADEAVAHGAAIRAAMLVDEQAGRPAAFTISNVNSHSLGVVGTEAQTGRRRNGILIPRNTPLPAARKRTFRTLRDNQQSILVRIVEGESRSADDCTPIGRCIVGDLPRQLPAGSPVEVLFRYQSNGRLRVQVTVPGAGRRIQRDILRPNSLDRQLLDAWRRQICGLDPADGY